jgi:death-on-curing protein
LAEPRFLTVEYVCDLHAEQIRRFGGAPELDRPEVLDSAVHAPQFLYLYEDEADLFDCAACYASHIAMNHPFREGNKRTALAAALGFLAENGLFVLTIGKLLVSFMEALVKRQMTQSDFAVLLCAGSVQQFISGQALKEQAVQHAFHLTGDVNTRTAMAVDQVTANARVILIEKCEEFGINPERFEDSVAEIEAILYPLVRGDLERLGMGFGLPPSPF